MIIVTGYPEGPNQLAQSSRTSLDFLFDKANKETAVAQVYLGPDPRQIKALPDYLKNALDKGNQVTLIVFSAGALSLERLPAEYFPKISSLVLISPVVGNESLRSNLSRYITTLAKILPGKDDYLKSLTPLFKKLQEENRPIKVVLGEKDQFIKSESVRQSFFEKFPDLSVAVKPRGHTPSPEEILDLIFQPKNQ